MLPPVAGVPPVPLVVPPVVVGVVPGVVPVVGGLGAALSEFAAAATFTVVIVPVFCTSGVGWPCEAGGWGS